ncbi:7948_t:CDS:2, partial [Acaulospora colombiana]
MGWFGAKLSGAIRVATQYDGSGEHSILTGSGVSVFQYECDYWEPDNRAIRRQGSDVVVFNSYSQLDYHAAEAQSRDSESNTTRRYSETNGRNPAYMPKAGLLGKPCKFLQRHLSRRVADPRQRFKRESEVWIRLRHQNIVPLYELVEDRELFGPYGAWILP